MKHRSINIVFILAFLNFAFVSFSANAEERGVEHLSGKTRKLLQKEMTAIDLAMKDIISANAAGDVTKISLIAKQIKESFILKKSLTKNQIHELHTKLPSDFLIKDQEFHYMAGMLEHAADNNKSELISFYYAKLFDACSNCHKLHAQHTFSKFSNKTETQHHHH